MFISDISWWNGQQNEQTAGFFVWYCSCCCHPHRMLAACNLGFEKHHGREGAHTQLLSIYFAGQELISILLTFLVTPWSQMLCFDVGWLKNSLKTCLSFPAFSHFLPSVFCRRQRRCHIHLPMPWERQLHFDTGNQWFHTWNVMSSAPSTVCVEHWPGGLNHGVPKLDCYFITLVWEI